MIVTSVIKYKGSTFEITLDSQDRVYLNSETVCKYGISNGVSISEERLNQVVYYDTVRKAKERALYLLDYKDYSYQELYNKLEVHYPQEVCFEVLSKLTKLGLIDDTKYAKRLAEKLILTKKYGLYRAVREMTLKGIDKQLAEEIASNYEDTQIDRVQELLNSKYSRYLNTNDSKDIVKVKNALVRMGYSYDVINQVLD